MKFKFVKVTKYRRKIKWFLYKSLFKRLTNLHFKASGRFFNRYAQKRLNKYSLKTNLIEYKNLVFKLYQRFVTHQVLANKRFIYFLKLKMLARFKRLLNVENV